MPITLFLPTLWIPHGKKFQLVIFEHRNLKYKICIFLYASHCNCPSDRHKETSPIGAMDICARGLLHQRWCVSGLIALVTIWLLQTCYLRRSQFSQRISAPRHKRISASSFPGCSLPQNSRHIFLRAKTLWNELNMLIGVLVVCQTDMLALLCFVCEELLC